MPQVQKIDFFNKKQIQSSECQTVFETITKNSDAVIELNGSSDEGEDEAEENEVSESSDGCKNYENEEKKANEESASSDGCENYENDDNDGK
ncbi:9212_t:CDS:2 [Racocetra fulgida]|uniref:9212_t:CDS:1 n=1 Tax=Racocetra fulgida TaxID=60492 RepID=A0A9N8ZUK8_9GLOM|nr:9212_t:CDS:2 [Racocetra fulgida]